MDAKITKQRLGNMLSYDWLKIILAIGAAIAVLCMLFTMIHTRPTVAQEYQIFAFGPISYGDGRGSFQNELDSIFSYEIMKTGQETISHNSTGAQVLTARRATKTGTVVFAPDYTTKEGEKTAYEYLCAFGMQEIGTPNEKMVSFLDLDAYFPACERYLAQFFGEDWETGEIDRETVRTTFLQRNKKDKRYRYSAKKREEGILDEEKRLTDLREDYLVVRAAFEDGTLSVVPYQYKILDEEGVDHGTGKEYHVAINVGALDGLKKIYYYSDSEGNRVCEKINLMLFDNGEKTEYTRYETVTLLRHLLENYSVS